jgi:hypothetical protein
MCAVSPRSGPGDRTRRLTAQTPFPKDAGENFPPAVRPQTTERLPVSSLLFRAYSSSSPWNFALRDRNQSLRPLPDRLPVQVRHSMLRDHVVHIPARRRRARPRLQRRHNPRHPAVLRRRRQCDNRQSALRPRRPAQEIHLPANPASLNTPARSDPLRSPN